MPDELHTPSHRYYQRQNHVMLTRDSFSRDTIFDAAIQIIDGSAAIASLFSVAGSRGFFYDFSDYATQFTDTAGTTPITGTGQSLARVNDKSGLGNHATQGTAGSQPLTVTFGAGYRGIQTDGVDDFLQTAAIDFSNSDKVTVIVGLRKLSDAARGMVVELATGANGTFGLNAPVSAAPNYQWSSQGTALANPVASPFAAPDTAVITGLGDISGDSAILRRNGVQVGSSAADQGTGNYSNAIVYLFRRGGTSLPANVVCTFMLVINRILTASEIAQIEAYANARTGAF